MSTPQIMVIGFGNSLRRDDGAGIALAEQLVERWLAQGLPVQLLTSTQIMPEMAADISRQDVEAVVFVDAAALASIHGIQISRVEAGPASPSSGHQLDPSTLLVYASLLYGRQPQAWLVTVPGVDFAHGEGFSSEVTKWLTNEIAAIASQLRTEILTEIRESIQCTNLELPNV